MSVETPTLDRSISHARELFSQWHEVHEGSIIFNLIVTTDSVAAELRDEESGAHELETAPTAELAVQRLASVIEERLMNGGLTIQEVPYWRAVDARERLQSLDRWHIECRLGPSVWWWRVNRWKHGRWTVRLKDTWSDTWIAERKGSGYEFHLKTVADLMALMHLARWPRHIEGEP